MIRKFYLGGDAEGGGDKKWYEQSVDMDGNPTKECAAAVYGALTKLGVDRWFGGNANESIDANFKGKYPFVVNGYQNLNATSDASKEEINSFHNLAAARVGLSFDSDVLNTNNVYIANLKFNNSPHTESFYNASVQKDHIDTYATHLGLIWYDEVNSSWKVYHSVHGHVENFDLNEKIKKQREFGEKVRGGKEKLSKNVTNNMIVAISDGIPLTEEKPVSKLKPKKDSSFLKYLGASWDPRFGHWHR